MVFYARLEETEALTRRPSWAPVSPAAYKPASYKPQYH